MKRVLLVIMITAALFSFAGCGRKKKAQEAYDAIGSMNISDESILTSEEQATIAYMRGRRENMLKNKDVDGLKALKTEWETFSGPIQELISVREAADRNLFTATDYNYITDDEMDTISAYRDRMDELYRERDIEGLSALAKEYREYCEPISAVVGTYFNIVHQAGLSDADQRLMSSEGLSELQNLSDSIEEAYESRDLSQLKSLDDQLDTFIADTKRSLENTKDKLLNDWVETANLTSSLTDLLSFGTTSTNTKVEGHEIIITTQYSKQAGVSDDQIEGALDSYLSLMSYVIQNGVDYLQQYIDDVCIRVEYKNANGSVVASREFK